MLTLAQLVDLTKDTLAQPANALATLFVYNLHLYWHLPCPDTLFLLRTVGVFILTAPIPIQIFRSKRFALHNEE